MPTDSRFRVEKKTELVVIVGLIAGKCCVLPYFLLLSQTINPGTDGLGYYRNMRVNVIKVFFCAITLLFAVSGAVAQSSAELKKQRERLNREIQELDKSIQSTANERSISLRQVNALTTQLRLREQKVATINSEIKILNNQIASHNKTIQDLRNQLAKLRKDYESMILFAFRNRNAHNKMMFIFASDDFNQAFKRIKYLQQFNESRKKRADEIAATQQEIALKVAQLEASKKEQAALLAEAQQERNLIAREQGAESKVLSALTTQEKEFKQELAKKQQEDARLAKAIDAAIRREVEEEIKRQEAARLAAAKLEAARTGKTVAEVEAERPAETKKTDAELLAATPAAAKLSADFASNRGRLPWPVQNGIITSRFGRHTMGRNVVVENEGIKIRTQANASVNAVFGGQVTTVMPMDGMGFLVIVRHGKYMTVYVNLRSVAVRRGQEVTVGQTLGQTYADDDGYSEIQFQVLEGFDHHNPEAWLAR